LIKGVNTAIATWAGITPAFQQIGTTTALAAFTTVAFSNTSTGSGQLWLGKSRAASVGTYDQIKSGDLLGEVRFYGSNTSGLVKAAAIGSYAEADANNGYISSSLRFSTTDTSETETMRLHRDMVGINNTAPTNHLSVGGNVWSNATIWIGNSTVNAVMNSSVLTIGTVTETSDISEKENIEYLNTHEALTVITELKGAKYNLKSEPGRELYGLIAQDVEGIIPNVVYGNETKSLRYSAIIPLLIESIKELKAEIDRLKK